MKRPSVFIGLAVLVAAACAYGQGMQTATLRGSVTDPEGLALPGVTVSVTSAALIGNRQAVTTETGDYVLRGLPPGDYTIRFTREGMQAIEQRMTLALGLSSRADAKMRVTAIREVIAVTAGSASVLENTTVGANITNDTVQRLPILRGPVAIASLAAGVTDRTPGGTQLSISGGMAYDNNFLINGVNIQDNLFGGITQLFVPDAIQETQVLTSGISAEYGHFTGGVLNAITRSGGNDYSGSIRDNMSKPGWLAPTPYEKGYRGKGVTPAKAIARTGNINHVYELTLGGPVIRDGLWFFFAARDENSTTPRTLNVTGATFNVQQKNLRPELKLTAAPASNHTVQASYIDNPVETSHSLQKTPLELAAVAVNGETPSHGWTAYYSGVLASSLFVETRYSEKIFGFRHMGGSSTNIVDSPIQTSQRFAGNSPGTYNAPPFDNADPEDRNNAQASATVSYFFARPRWGSHDLKSGYERFVETRTGGNSQSATSYVFDTGYKVSAGSPVYDSAGRLIPVFSPVSAGQATVTNIYWVIATRGAELDTTTESLFINDRWNVNGRVSFNIGARYEKAKTVSTGGIVGVNTSNAVPRLAASYDPLGTGRCKFDVTYAQYVGRYGTSLAGANSPVGHPAVLQGQYTGPAGEGRDFAPGFDPRNYAFVSANVPTANVFMGSGLHAPVNHEWTASAGSALPKGGWVKATFTGRKLKGLIDDFITIDQGCTDVVFGGVNAGCIDNVWIRNTSVPKRDYQAVELQVRYNLTSAWDLEGNWTHQLKNDGIYEGEAGQGIFMSLYGDRPEMQSPRELPYGRLAQFQAQRVRLWTTYTLNLKSAGNLTGALLYRFDSASTFSYTATVPRSSVSQSLDPGYKNTPINVLLFFGDRGSGEFHSTSLFDASLQYSLPIAKKIIPWLKFDVSNVFNDDTQIAWNTAITPDSNSPKDDMGYATAYRKGTAFGRPTGTGSYVRPREYRLYAGIRF